MLVNMKVILKAPNLDPQRTNRVGFLIAAPLLLSCLLGSTVGSNILAVFPYPGKSHFYVFEPLVKELAARGHHVTVLSFFPQKSVTPNYTDISLDGLMPIQEDLFIAKRFQSSSKTSFFTKYISFSGSGLANCEVVFNSKQVKDLIESRKTFDLLLVELLSTDCFFSLSQVFAAPYVGFSSCVPHAHHDPRIGNPDELSYDNDIYMPFVHPMSFVVRFMNVVSTVLMRLLRSHYYLVKEEKIVKQVLVKPVSLHKVAHDVGIVFVNSHLSMQGALPKVPGYIEVGGIHIRPAKPVHKELDQYLSESPEGAILFSMGSVLQSSSFPPDKRQAIMEAFAELPVRVIMKWENDSVPLPGQPANVKLSKWLPQRDILAHPKIVAFMGHGGLLSTSEAVYCGVPMVLIPMFGDQPNNVAHLSALGAAVKLAYEDISKETVLSALRAVLYDASYRENAKVVSERFRDRPMSPLDTAVYWTEYVLRHKGARHLRSPAVDMPWYQLWLLDVAAVLITGTAVAIWLLYWLVKQAVKFILQRKTKKHTD